jgi:hypothetical protein
MLVNSGADQSNDPVVLRNEIEDLKKVIQFLQQQNNDMRAKLYALTMQPNNGGHHDSLVYKSGIEIPEYMHEEHGHHPSNSHHHQAAASDLNDLSNVAQQIGDSSSRDSLHHPQHLQHHQQLQHHMHQQQQQSAN